MLQYLKNESVLSFFSTGVLLVARVSVGIVLQAVGAATENARSPD